MITITNIVKQKLNDRNLDCLINNGEIAINGPSILIKTDDFRQQFEVN